MDNPRKGVCTFAWRCLRYNKISAACNREGGGPFCAEWRRFNTPRVEKKRK